MLPGVLSLTLVLITFRGVLDVHAPPNAASAAISFVAGVSNFSGVNLIVAISGFVGGGNKGMLK